MLNLDWNKISEAFLYDPKQPLVFNSGLFFWLFPFVFLVYLAIWNRPGARTLYLILFSLFFYYKSSGIYVSLLILNAIVNFVIAGKVEKHLDTKKAKAWMILSLVFNLGILAYFKYTLFIAGIFESISGTQFSISRIFLPVGISFFTFEAISYVVDVYRKHIKHTDSFLDFAFFTRT
jgi:D-alanyl-lipoteichoic acid acyltransferase DltB (MBOAT superfamily)